MGIRKKAWMAALALAQVMLLSACGGGDTQAPASSVAEPNPPSASSPAEESAGLPSAEGKDIFYTGYGISYPSELGESVLGKLAADLADSASRSSAAEQIANVGDAIYYLQSAEPFDQPVDTCKLFAELLEGDYDEVGLIHFYRPDNYYCLAYVRTGETFYPFDPFMLAMGNSAWFAGQRSASVGTTDLEALCNELMETFPHNGPDNPMKTFEIEPLFVGSSQGNTASGQPVEIAPASCTVNGISYDGKLGAPVLGKTAAELAHTASSSTAAKQINNVGDAIYYLQSVEPFDQPVDTCKLFAELLEGDYDEVGLIHFYRPDNYYCLAYVRMGELFYPFDPFILAMGNSAWFADHRNASVGTTDLEALCNELMETFPHNGPNNPMKTFEIEPLFVGPSQGNTAPGQPGQPGESASASYTINGMSYDGKLGAPVLGKDAAELVHTVSASTAAKQINNVGDAFYYMQAIGPFDQPSDACTLFTQLIGGDYDEVGMIYLERPDNGYVLAYVRQNDIYYPMDIGSICKGRISWIEKEEYSSGTDLNALCDKLMTSFPYNPQREPMTSFWTEVVATYHTEVESDLVAYLTTPQYSKEQIAQWVAEGLTLEQWAEKIKVPADAIQALNALGYGTMQYNDNVTFNDSNGVHWAAMWNAQTVFDHRNGNCGGTSNIMNAFLNGDFDQQGYVQSTGANGGHIFNYFVLDGTYVFCDFVGIPGRCIFGNGRTSSADTSDYIAYVCDSPEEFKNWYLNEGYFAHEFDNPDIEGYLYQLLMCSREGSALPRGVDDQTKRTKFDNFVWDIYPEQYKDDYIFLYEREGYPARFRTLPAPDTWPEEIR